MKNIKKSMYLIILLSLSLLYYSCKTNNTPPIYIKTTKIKGTEGKEHRMDSISTLTSEYFKIKLESMQSGKFYIAEESIKQVIINKDIDFEFLNIVDEKGKKLEFKNSTEFLNFMAERGYEMKEQIEKKFSFNYTFKRKD